MNIKIKGKTYKLKKEVLIIAGVVLAVLISLFAISKPTSEVEEEEVLIEDVDKDYDASSGVLDTSQLGNTVLEETEDAGQKYIDSTLFLGDSNTARFLRILDPETKKTFTTKENTIGVVGMGIDAISSLACMDFSTGRVPMPQAVKILQPERVIITFGTNNLYGTSTDATSFIERYTKQIKAIEDSYPSVDIIINSLPPVSKQRDYVNVSMQQIDAYNQAIANMCKKNKWKYLNSAEALKDEKTGYAKQGYMVSDGLHFDQKGLVALFQYIRNHAYITEDDRPKPLATIPTIIGVPAGLIQVNPLTNNTFEEEPIPEVEETQAPTSSPEPKEEPKEDLTTEQGCNDAHGEGSWYGGVCFASPEAANAQRERDAQIANCTSNGGQWTDSGCQYPQNPGDGSNDGDNSGGGQEPSGGENPPGGDNPPTNEDPGDDVPQNPEPESQPETPENPEE